MGKWSYWFLFFAAFGAICSSVKYYNRLLAVEKENTELKWDCNGLEYKLEKVCSERDKLLEQVDSLKELHNLK